MVRRGRSSRLDEIQDEVCKVLLAVGPLGFTELHERLSKSAEERRAGSPSTLSRCLKDLARAGMVERDIDTRKWNLTSVGRLSLVAHEQLSNPKVKTPLQQTALFLLVKEARPEAWWDFVESVARSLQIWKHVKDLPEEEVMKNLKSYTQQTKHAVTAVWSGIISDMILDLGTLLAGILLICSLYPSPMGKDAMSKMTNVIHNMVTEWGKVTTERIERIVAANVLNLEILVALDKALQDKKLDDSVMKMPVSEVTKKLQALGYLKVEKEPAG
jgi:hypothetical protein